MFADDALTCDAFLGGKIRVYQPRSGYRAGVDPVLLAACVNATAGQTVLELGCGSGVASLCLAARVAGVTFFGVERQQEYAELARRNAQMNNVEMTVADADLTALPAMLRQQRFDHVIANPPYYLRARGTSARDPGREAALGEDTDIRDWVHVAAKRLAPKGYMHFIHRAERLPDLLAACAGRLGSIEVLPLIPRAGREAQLVVLRARAGGRAAFRLHAPIVLHDGDSHGRDGEDYAPLIRSVLRGGAGIEIGN